MYEKHNWVNGEVITAEKLNHIEGGVYSSLTTFKIGLIHDVDNETWTADKTFNEIKEAYDNNYRIEISTITEGIDSYSVSIPFSCYDEDPSALFIFKGLAYSSSLKDIEVYIYSEHIECYSNNTQPFAARVDFYRSGNNVYSASFYDLEQNREITLEEYLDGDWYDILSNVSDESMDGQNRKIVVLGKTDFLDILHSTPDYVEFRYLTMNSQDGTISQFVFRMSAN